MRNLWSKKPGKNQVGLIGREEQVRNDGLTFVPGVHCVARGEESC